MNFIGNNFYHIYNRGNNKQLIFPLEKNYDFFLNKIQSELRNFCDIMAYCLMPNHFHLLIYVNEKSNGLSILPKQSHQILTRKIGTILSSYSQAINKQEKKTGSLFQQKTKAKLIESDYYATTCLHYVHQNPLRAGLVKRLEDWKYSSFNHYLQNDSTICNLPLAKELLLIQLQSELFYEESYSVVPDSVIRAFLD